MESLQQTRHTEAVRHHDNLMFIMSVLALVGALVIMIILIRLRQVTAKMKEGVSELENQKFAMDQHSIVAITDRSGRITYANDKFCEISQYSREELIGQNHRILNSAFHPKIFFFNMWETISKGDIWHGEIQNKRKDGSLYWAETSIIPFLGKQGKVDRYIAIRTDITTRKAEEARSASLARFPAETPYPVLRLDHAGTIMYANHASHRMLEALHITIGDILPAKMLQDCKAAFTDQNILKTELMIGCEIFELTYSTLPNTFDVNLYAHNISDVKRSLETIADSEQRIRQVMDTALDGMIMVDANGQVTYWNPQAEKIFGWTSDEMIGESSLDKLFPPEQMLAVQQQFTSMMNQRTEITGLHKSGETLHIELSVLMIKTKGIFDYFSIIMHDISERILSEKKLEEARDLAVESSKMKSMFLSTVSHEIRTPMNGIIGMTDLLLDTHLDAEQREFSKTIRASSDALLVIINDILDFSKIEAGHMDIDIDAFSLLSMIEGSVGVVAIKAHAKGLGLNVFVDPAIPAILVGDAGRLRQIILNLVDNAVKFTTEGDVNIHVKFIRQIENQVTLTFSVRDTGIGLSAEAQNRLFQPFVQADGSTTRKYGGTGLGLSICKKLVQLMGGDIQLYSQLGKGSMFSFELILPISDDLELLAAGYDLSLLTGLRVLIADSDTNACFILERYLASWGMQVSSVSDAASALQLLQSDHVSEKNIDLMIISQELSNQSAVELALEIRQSPDIAHIPMILHADYDHSELKQQALDAGFRSVLPKPVNMSHLFNCVVQALCIDVMQENFELQEEIREGDSDQLLLSGIHVLLAEDNPVNQKVAQMHLSKLGCIVHTVNDGQQAVHAMMQDDTYDIILMDCQMPVMDGFKATQNIRAYEAEKGGRRRIIAMTANAMKGDREKCLQSGMDDYMSKPVSRDKIAELISHNLVNNHEMLQLRQDNNDMPSHADGINLDHLRDLFGDDHEAIAEILGLFKQSMQQILKQKMPHALKARNSKIMKMLAHELKGAAANIGGENIAVLCTQLETQAETACWDDMHSNIQQLSDAYNQLDQMCIKPGVEE